MNLIIKNIVVFFGKIFFAFKKKQIPKNPKKILIMRSGGIGDVLMSTPLVKSIRQTYTRAEITYFVGKWSKEVIKDNPDIDKISSYNDLIIINMRVFEIFKLIKQIKKQKFDLVFNLEKSWHWGLLSFLFGIPFRVGFDRKGEGFANNLTVPFEGLKYELEYYLDLTRLLSIKVPSQDMEIYLTKQEKQISDKFIKNNKLNNKKIIGIAPGGADNPAQQAFIKRWPLENYVKLIDRMLEENKNAFFILFGGKNDIETCDEIKEKIKGKKNIVSAAGKLSIKEGAALMKYCKVFITHDSGPMHIAAAARTKLIALFGPTPSARFAPKKAEVIEVKNDRCPCYDIYGTFKDCKETCTELITVDDVLRKIRKLK